MTTKPTNHHYEANALSRTWEIFVFEAADDAQASGIAAREFRVSCDEIEIRRLA